MQNKDFYKQTFQHR